MNPLPHFSLHTTLLSPISKLGKACPGQVNTGILRVFDTMPSLKNSILALILLASANRGDAQEKDTWPEFRGLNSNGIVTGTRGLPLKWSETQNIVWKTAINGRAWSSPVIAEGKIWLTNATKDGKEMSAVCLNAKSGEILHSVPLFSNTLVEPLGNSINGYGSPSPVIEQGRVYVHFGSYGTAAINTSNGNVLWKRTDLPCRHFRGPGSSPVLYNDLLILTMDGIDVQYLVALDPVSGKTVWKTDRSTKWTDIEPGGKIRGGGDLRKAYTTPTFTKVGNETIMISPGAKACFAYNPTNGKELWHITYTGYSNASRTVISDGHALINTGYGKPHLVSLKLDPQARGDITKSHIVWDIFKRVPKRSSPIVVGKQLYMTTDEGILSCIDLNSGKELWSDRLRGHFSASPIMADGRIYFFSEMGYCYVINPGKSFQLLASNKLDDSFMASPAVAGKAIYARGKAHIYRIEHQ